MPHRRASILVIDGIYTAQTFRAAGAQLDSLIFFMDGQTGAALAYRVLVTTVAFDGDEFHPGEVLFESGTLLESVAGGQHKVTIDTGKLALNPNQTYAFVIDAFADAILALDDSIPNGTYIDMCSKLPIVDPARIACPTIVMRGQWDGIAAIEDLLAFFQRLPNPDKQFAVMPGISHASFQQKNYLLVYHILGSFFAQPAPVYRA